jgi:alpha-galactosidase
LLLSRNQLVLDLTRPAVTQYLFDAMDALLGSLPIAYVKWDMNRDISHPGGRDGRASTARQVRAVYALMDRIRAAHPSVEIESCASGGGRADYGVLQRTHRLWTSDSTDALERLEIQRGASLFFPPEVLGAHIAAAPNHQTGRRHTLAFRAVVALAYHLGVELDPLKLAESEREELAVWIALHKRLRPLLHGGGERFQLAPRDGRYVWGAAARRRIALFVAQGPQSLCEQPAPLTLPSLILDEGRWRIAAVHPSAPAFIRISAQQGELLTGERTFGGATISHGGLNLPMLRPESGMLLEIETVDGGGHDHGRG